MSTFEPLLFTFLTGVWLTSQGCYLAAFLVDCYLYSLPVNWVRVDEARILPPSSYPYIVMFYPVLREAEATMRTTFLALEKIEYPRDKYRVVAIPNANDTETVASLRRLQQEFPFLQIIEVPPTDDPSWQVVWNAWDGNQKAYWWHQGERAGDRNLPPKKTRQLIYAFYRMADELAGTSDFLVNYLDADSCPPPDHFLAAAAGIRHYDVLQAQNIAGNLNDTMAATWHAFDHMAWDGLKFPHISSNGRQPFWMLGKGLYFKASDLVALGGFHPWITIEDPEVGMRFWVNGKRLGIIQNPLIEEVPTTVREGISQRKRWICGFFQSLGEPLKLMGMTPWQRVKAWINFLPCLSLSINAIGMPIGIWAAWSYFTDQGILPQWTVWVAVATISLHSLLLLKLYVSAWQRSAIVLSSIHERVWFLIRGNPISLTIWWLMWLIPLWLGWRMYMRGDGLVWQRTEKVDANHLLVRTKVADATVPTATFQSAA